MFVAVSGPSGAGKSDAIEALSRLGLRVVSEPSPPEPKDRSAIDCAIADGFAKERDIVERRASLLRDALVYPRVFIDRSLEEDRSVFFPLYQALGALTQAERARLEALPALSDPRLRASAYAVLLAPERILRSRLIRRRAPNWLIESLPLQVQLYQKWVGSLTCSAVNLDTTTMSPQELADAVSEYSDLLATS